MAKKKKAAVYRGQKPTAKMMRPDEIRQWASQLSAKAEELALICSDMEKMDIPMINPPPAPFLTASDELDKLVRITRERMLRKVRQQAKQHAREKYIE